MSEVLSQGAVLAALFGGLVAGVGWFVVHHLQYRRSEEDRRAKAELEFVERQIEELYGPLAAILHEGRRSFLELCLTLGRNYVFHGDESLPDDELSTWLYWCDQEFLPRNERITELLHTKAHLIQGAAFPQSYIDFFQHATSWATHHRRWLDQGVAYRWRARVAWPLEFETDVFRAFSDLKQRHDNLLGRISARA